MEVAAELHKRASQKNEDNNLEVEAFHHAFFGLSTFVLGYLVFKSDYFPRILGILLVIVSFAYHLDSFGIFLLPAYEAIIAESMVNIMT